MVRNTLGEEAVIVATREENGGRSVRVTAAVEQFDPDFDTARTPNQARRHSERNSPAPSTMDEDEGWLQYDDEADYDNQLTDALTEALIQQGVSDEILESLVSTAMMTGHPDMDDALAAAMDHLYGFVPLPRKASRKAMMLVGTPGSGKTLAVAKLAARAAMEDLSVTVITCDTIRAGGVEQLEAFTRLLQIQLHQARDAHELKSCLLAHKDADQIIIDTAGVNPFDLDEMTGLARLIEAGSIDPILVLPSGQDADDSGEIARSFAVLGAQKLLPTRLDISRRLGGLLSAAQIGGLSFTDSSNTSKVANGLVPLSPLRMARELLPRLAFRGDSQNNTNKGHQSPNNKNAPSRGKNTKSGPSGPRATKRRA